MSICRTPSVNGYTNFNRYYFAQNDKQGAVIDERFNGGGWIADYIVDWLKRPLLAAAMTREGKDNYDSADDFWAEGHAHQ